MLGIKINNIVFIFFYLTAFAFGQESQDSSFFKDGICDREGYCVPRISGLGKAKGLEIKYRNIFKYAVDTRLVDKDTSYSDYINRDRKVGVKIKIPILYKNSFKLILGLQYASEEFKFKEQEVISNSFYAALNRKPLQSFGTTVYATKPFIGNKYLFVRANFRVSGDFSQNSLEDYFKSSVSVLYGTRKNSTFAWGVGASYSYTFGRQLIIPVVSLAKQLSHKWSFDALLPVRMKLRYSGNAKNAFELETKISGENYNITLEPIADHNLFIQRSDWLFTAKYEREIYDFIWFGASVGNRYNLSFDLYEKNAFISRAAPVITNHLMNTFFAEVSLFLVPPRKMVEKFDKKQL